jgi:hypothetical protein
VRFPAIELSDVLSDWCVAAFIRPPSSLNLLVTNGIEGSDNKQWAIIAQRKLGFSIKTRFWQKTSTK